MNRSLPSLIQRLLAARPSTPAWQSALAELVEAVLKRRKIAKRYSNQSLEGVYQEMYTELKDKLVEAIQPMALDESLTPAALKSILHQASQDILTYDRLTQMAVHLQQQHFRSPPWQHALNALFDAVYLSGKLKRPTTYSNTWDAHLDITNEALMQAIKDIQKFDPTRAHFIGWVNQLYIVRRSATTRQQQEDTLTRGYHRQVMSNKHALSKTVSRSQDKADTEQLMYYLKGAIRDIEQDTYLCLSFLIYLLQRQIQKDPTKGNEMLFEIAEIATERKVKFESLDVLKNYEDGGQQSKEIGSTVFEEAPKLDFLRECLQTCQLDKCADILQKYIKSNPRATFRAIALLRIEGKTLKEIANLFEVVIPTVQKFYERNMLKAADSLKICVEDKVAIWEDMHRPST